MAEATDIWTYQAAVSRRLLWWAGLSTAVGGALLFGGEFWRGFGLQAVVWGLIDAGVALVGLLLMKRRRGRLIDPFAPDVLAREARKLGRILWLNVALDALYVAAGCWLALTLGERSGFWQGTGWGVAAQGEFLFWFDLLHALLIPRPPASVQRNAMPTRKPG